MNDFEWQKLLFLSDFLLKYLAHMEKGAQFRMRMAEINERVETEFDGSRTYHDIEILVGFIFE